MVKDLGENGSASIHPSLSVMGVTAGRPVLGHIGPQTLQIGKSINTA
jgi:hypothetical protein